MPQVFASFAIWLLGVTQYVLNTRKDIVNARTGLCNAAWIQASFCVCIGLSSTVYRRDGERNLGKWKSCDFANLVSSQICQVNAGAGEGLMVWNRKFDKTEIKKISPSNWPQRWVAPDQVYRESR